MTPSKSKHSPEPWTCRENMAGFWVLYDAQKVPIGQFYAEADAKRAVEIVAKNITLLNENHEGAAANLALKALYARIAKLDAGGRTLTIEEAAAMAKNTADAARQRERTFWKAETMREE